MTKPHEENWELDADGDIRRLNRRGVRTSLVFLRAATGDPECAFLASKAPKMARALLEVMNCNAVFAPCRDCRDNAEKVLREAGVLE